MITKFRAGPGGVSVGIPNNIGLPVLTGMAFTASGTTADALPFLNSFRQPLLTTDTYQVCVTLTGQDKATDGWADGPSTSTSGNIVLTAGQNAIYVLLSNANWPSGFNNAAYVSIWLKINGGNFQLAECAPMDTINDMVVIIKAKPLQQYTQIPLATLQSSAANTTLYPEIGSRVPYGFNFVTQSPTTEEVTVTFDPTGSVTFSPNNAADFTVTSSRSAKVNYKTMANDTLTFVEASFGDYAQVTTGGHTYQGADMAINTAQIVVPGNRPFILTPPPDPTTGVSESWLFTSLVLRNFSQIVQAWSKKAQTPTPFEFQTIPSDAKFNNAPTVYTYYRQ